MSSYKVNPRLIRKTLPSKACLLNKYCLLHLLEPEWPGTPLSFLYPTGICAYQLRVMVNFCTSILLPESSPVAKFAAVFLPPVFLDAIRALMLAELLMDDFIAACQRPLRRSLRVNTLKISVIDFLALVQAYDWRLEPIPWCAEGFWIDREDEELPLGSSAENLIGLFYIQEASSMLPVSVLFADGGKPHRVLDIAAAPGSKTIQIAALMNNKGGIVANEYSSSRVKVLHANLSRSGVKNVALTHFDGRVFGAALPESFDAILLDAPCSCEGVVRKDPDAMGHWSPESVAEFADTPTRIDRQRSPRAGDGWRDGLFHLYPQRAVKSANCPMVAHHIRGRSQRRTARRAVPWRTTSSYC